MDNGGGRELLRFVTLSLALAATLTSTSAASSDFLVLTSGPGRSTIGGSEVTFEGSGSNGLEKWSPGATVGSVLSSGLPSGIYNFNAAVDADGGRLFYATQDAVQVVDAESGVLLSTLPSPRPFYCLRFDRTRERMFALRPLGARNSRFDGGTTVYTHDRELLLEIDPSSGSVEVKGELPGGLRNYNCTLDVAGRRFFYQTGDALVVASLDSGALLASLPLALNLYGLEFDSASGLLYAMVVDPDCVGAHCGESGASFYAAYRTTPNKLVAIDPDSGVTVDVGTDLPGGGMNFLSALDARTGTFRYRTRDELIAVSMLSGAVLQRTVVPEIWVAMNGLAPTRMAVQIDIRPGSDRNAVNVRSRGVLPVAILGSPEFNVRTVDFASVRLGAGGARAVHRRGHLRDVDGDGEVDLLLHFRIRAVGILCGDTSIALVGSLRSGGTFEGSDVIRTVGCR